MDALELCAVRMTKLLNNTPRRAVTRAYVATFPKRKKSVVTPSDYAAAQSAARAVIAKAAAKSEAAEPVIVSQQTSAVQRKDRRRPRARDNYKPVSGIVHLLARVQSYLCAGCGHEMGGEWPNERATVDHVLPLSLGGKNGAGNLVAMHSGCNNKKAARMPTGCERIWLLAVNARLQTYPQK